MKTKTFLSRSLQDRFNNKNFITGSVTDKWCSNQSVSSINLTLNIVEINTRKYFLRFPYSLCSNSFFLIMWYGRRQGITIQKLKKM